jgi:CHAT domain-containing protein/Tfp pilus assembly protein PilF
VELEEAIERVRRLAAESQRIENEGDVDGAIALYDQALDLIGPLLERADPQTRRSATLQEMAGSLEYQIGWKEHHRGNLERAERHYQRAMELFREVDRKSEEFEGARQALMEVTQERVDDALEPVLRLAAESQRIENEGDLDGAIALYQQALERIESLLEGVDRETSFSATLRWQAGALEEQIAWIDHQRGDLDRAEEHYGRALELRGAVDPESNEFAGALQGLAEVNRDRGDLDRAEEHYERALEVFDALDPDSEQVAITLQGLGSLHQARGELDRAQGDLERALEIFGFEQEWERFAAALRRLVMIDRERGDLDHAAERLTRAVELSEEMAPSEQVVAALMDLAGVEEERRQFTRAQEHFERALELSERLEPESERVAMALAGIGAVHLDRGDLDRAEEHFERAFELAQRIAPSSETLAIALLGLGRIDRERGDLDRAAGRLTRAVQLSEEVAPDSEQVARALMDLASVHLLRGEYERAEQHYERALALTERIAPDSESVAIGLVNVGNVLEARGELSLAREHFERALALSARVTPESEQVVAALAGLGRIYRDQGDLGRAQGFCEQALALAGRIAPGSKRVAMALHNLGAVCSDRGDLDGAKVHFERALELYETIAPSTEGVAGALSDLGVHYRTRGEVGRAIDHLERAVEVTESLRARAGSTAAREQLFALHQNPFQALIAALGERRAKGDAEAAFACAERSRARALVELLAERQVEIRADTPEQEERQQALLAEERTLQHRLATAYNRLATARSDPTQAELVPALDAEESQLAKELEDHRKRIWDEFKAYAEIEYPDPLGVEGAKALLGPETLLLEYDASGAEAFLWALRSERFEMFSLEASGERFAELVEEAVGRYRRGEDASAGAEEARAELSRLLLAPVPEPFWRGCERLLIVPDGALHYLPFEILPAPEGGGATLIDRYALAYAPSATALASILADERPRTVHREFVGFGDPKFDGGGEEGEAEHRFASRGVGLAPLRATRKEVSQIAKGFTGPAETYLGSEATEFRAKRETEGARFVHFSTHGLLDDRNPLYSGLALSPPRPEELEADEALDDCLQVYEMFGLRLSAEAVVCSACQTGLGTIHAGEGLVGMSRALFFAGARCVVVSLWPVPNLFTARLMERFYSELQSKPLAEALKEAKLAIRERYPDPFNWAAFVAVGVGW